MPWELPISLDQLTISGRSHPAWCRQRRIGHAQGRCRRITSWDWQTLWKRLQIWPGEQEQQIQTAQQAKLEAGW